MVFAITVVSVVVVDPSIRVRTHPGKYWNFIIIIASVECSAISAKVNKVEELASLAKQIAKLQDDIINCH